MNAILQGESFMAVDDKRGARKVVQGRRVRHYNYQPLLEPVTRVSVLVEALPAIEARIRLTRRKRACGSFVFISPERDVFVLSEESNIAADWVLTKLPWLVGLYCPKKVRIQAPAGLGEVVDLDLEGLEGDISEHLAQLDAVPSAPVQEPEPPVIAKGASPREVPRRLPTQIGAFAGLEAKFYWYVDGTGYSGMGHVFAAAKAKGFQGSRGTLRQRLRDGDATWERLLRPLRGGRA